MTLNQFAKASKVIASEHKQTDLIEVFIEKNIVKQLPVYSINQIYIDLVNTFKGQGNFKEKVIIDGKLFVFETDLKNAPYGMMADIHSLEEQGTFDNLHKIAAILYRPAKINIFKKYVQKPYDGEYEKRSELFRYKLKGDLVAGMLVFFLVLLKKLEIHSQDYTHHQYSQTS